MTPASLTLASSGSDVNTGAITAPALYAGRLPALDGLRGTAILAVLICHYSNLLPLGYSWTGILEGGWVGVDLFFVLSGFLITGILCDAKGTAHFFRNFYARRTLRIFPLYYGFLLLTLAMLLVLHFKHDSRLDAIWPAQPWLWTYTANYWIAHQPLWTPAIDAIVPLWSLSIEEQFYLLWPVAVFFLSLRNLMRTCVAVMLGSLILRLVLTTKGASFIVIHLWTPTRADSLAAGALLALLLRLHGNDPRLRMAISLIGTFAGLLIISLAPGFNPELHPILRDLLYTPLAIFFAALIFWSINPASLAGIPSRFYAWFPLRAIGRYSYGIYILHLPLMHITRSVLLRYARDFIADDDWTTSLIMITTNLVAMLVIAVISFEIYEKQFLKLKRRFSAKSMTAPVPDAPGDAQPAVGL